MEAAKCVGTLTCSVYFISLLNRNETNLNLTLTLSLNSHGTSLALTHYYITDSTSLFAFF